MSWLTYALQRAFPILCTAICLVSAGCRSPQTWQEFPGRGVVAVAEFIPVDAVVIRWFDRGGLNTYRADGTGHFGQRGGRAAWTLDDLRRHIDLVVIHYDAVGGSRACFDVLQKRGLSCHFLIDTDGTIYQTLDLRERAWHATVANDRSIGIELAHHGAIDADGGAGRPGDAIGVIQGRRLRQPPFTNAQYGALADLLAAMNDAFPKIALDYPRDAEGALIRHKLPEADLAAFTGILGHYHVQTNKVDPGPAFDWDRVIRQAQRKRRMR